MNELPPQATREQIELMIDEVRQELYRAVAAYPAMQSAHEGWAVLYEEVDELWDEVKKSPKKRDYEAMHTEGVQTAAMALRFLLDVTLPKVSE